MARSKVHACECSDPGCPVHKGRDCDHVERGRVLYRVDMEDRTGTYFCPACQEDAYDSGLFTDERPRA